MLPGSPGSLQTFTFGEAASSAAAAWALALFTGNSEQEQTNHKQELICMLKPQLVVRAAPLQMQLDSEQAVQADLVFWCL